VGPDELPRKLSRNRFDAAVSRSESFVIHEVAMNNRYQVGGIQAAIQPGSHGQVLLNKLGVTTAEDMAELELVLLQKLYEAVLAELSPDAAFTLAHLKTWHRRWLGNVYEWAGEERSVNVSKDGFHFAVAAQIPRLLALFERDCLARFTPCHRLEHDDLIEAIAVTHVEFILIHPFREGNGRLSRLLADAMATQAGHGPLDYSAWDADREGYFTAVQAGVAGDYAPMQRYVGSAF
jgi:cell filamentation protein